MFGEHEEWGAKHFDGTVQSHCATSVGISFTGKQALSRVPVHLSTQLQIGGLQGIDFSCVLQYTSDKLGAEDAR
jgi:hypothetical protein